ncbi:hypothetical protein AB0N31_03275 [Streptomyces sp. NPDC051051]
MTSSRDRLAVAADGNRTDRLLPGKVHASRAGLRISGAWRR